MDTIIDLLSNGFVLLALFTIIVVVLIVAIFLWFTGFSEERRYILMEMYRSGPEGRKHWEKRLKQLYLAQIPIIGSFLSNRVK